MILLNPGPVRLSDRVRAAFQRPDLCHREPEFGALQQSIRERLLAVYDLDPERFAAVLVSGSGTAAVEAMVASLVPRSGRLLVLQNGVYGERIARIADVYGIERIDLGVDWGEDLPLARVADALDRAPRATHLAAVHHETTTGKLNRLEPLGALCLERGVELLVDAVSSFGAEHLDPDGWGIGACAATAGKCLHGAPGLSFVVVRRDLLTRASSPARSVYLDLRTHAREQDAQSTAFTPAVPVYYALREALDELDEQGGWRARRRRYAELGGRIALALEAYGVAPLLAAADSSVALRSYALPPGMSYGQLHRELKLRGFVIYAGQGSLSDRLFRISTMGWISDGDVARLLDAFAEILPAEAEGVSDAR